MTNVGHWSHGQRLSQPGGGGKIVTRLLSVHPWLYAACAAVVRQRDSVDSMSRREIRAVVHSVSPGSGRRVSICTSGERRDAGWLTLSSLWSPGSQRQVRCPGPGVSDESDRGDRSPPCSGGISTRGMTTLASRCATASHTVTAVVCRADGANEVISGLSCEARAEVI